jgi:5-formyltetrahydrofolate cyclo-ligase
MEDDERGGSDPCMEHLLIDGKPVDGATLRDVSRFRTAERSRLMELRRRIPTLDRTAMTATLCEAIETLVSPKQGMRIAVYWPIRGEPDLRGWMKQAHNAGASLLLPVVVEKNAPLVFRAWSPDCEMERGIWNIPVPADGKEMVPDVVISPLLGIDEACFRLGNGGGYYDRTLARIDPPPKVIGVGFSDCVIPSIFPMPWDIPMDSVVLTDGSIRHRS